MQQIINFVIKYKTFLLFLALFSLSLALTIQSHAYHRSKFINSANAFSGSIYGTVNSINSYFDLKQKNELLIEENKNLREQLYNSVTINKDTLISTSILNTKYKITSAEVYKNSYSVSNNILTINKGKKDSIKQDFGVITSKGIVGIIDNTSNNYATVLSILSKKSKINAKLKNYNHIGSLIWDGKSPKFVQLIDVSIFAPVKVGDTIVTGGQSSIFPPRINIGRIERLETDINSDTYIIQVKLFNDMKSIGTVYIIDNRDRNEILTLQNSYNE